MHVLELFTRRSVQHYCDLRISHGLLRQIRPRSWMMMHSTAWIGPMLGLLQTNKRLLTHRRSKPPKSTRLATFWGNTFWEVGFDPYQSHTILNLFRWSSSSIQTFFDLIIKLGEDIHNSITQKNTTIWKPYLLARPGTSWSASLTASFQRLARSDPLSEISRKTIRRVLLPNSGLICFGSFGHCYFQLLNSSSIMVDRNILRK